MNNAEREVANRYMAGGCANGAHRDSGSKVHAVPENDYYSSAKAVCGRRPRITWSDPVERAVTCPACLKRLGKQARRACKIDPVQEKAACFRLATWFVASTAGKAISTEGLARFLFEQRQAARKLRRPAVEQEFDAIQVDGWLESYVAPTQRGAKWLCEQKRLLRACAPDDVGAAWSAEYEEQNALQAEYDDEPLAAAEFIRCRLEDLLADRKGGAPTPW